MPSSLDDKSRRRRVAGVLAARALCRGTVERRDQAVAHRLDQIGRDQDDQFGFLMLETLRLKKKIILGN